MNLPPPTRDEYLAAQDVVRRYNEHHHPAAVYIHAGTQDEADEWIRSTGRSNQTARYISSDLDLRGKRNLRVAFVGSYLSHRYHWRIMDSLRVACYSSL